jgi:acetyltransferase-like isoleucine patch superfamily enzyme/acyl carrier protein
MSLADRVWLRDAQIGARARLIGRPLIQCAGELLIGDDFFLRSRPVRSHFVIGAGARLVLGHGVTFDHGAAVSCFSEIAVGDGASFGPFAILLDSDFHQVTDRASAGAPKPIKIGAGARLGARVTVLRGAVIGAGAVIEPGSTVARAIPPGVRAGGVPARVLGEADALHATRAGDLGEIVPRAVMTALGLDEPPQLTASRKLFPRWDGLAAARIAALIQEELGLDLPRDDLVHAASVGEILDRVAAVLGRETQPRAR